MINTNCHKIAFKQHTLTYNISDIISEKCLQRYTNVKMLNEFGYYIECRQI